MIHELKRVDYLTYRLTNTTYISVDLAHYEIFHAKVGKGGINCNIKDPYLSLDEPNILLDEVYMYVKYKKYQML